MIKYDDTTGESKEYAEFVEKFKPKKTTDDCYTPDNIYAAVLEFATKEYDLAGREVLRPFYPGGDYEHADYPDGCVVVDNPPFSILSKICRFYDDRGIDYFLFAPSLTLFSTNAGNSNYIIADASITYENGANVQTGFITNMGRYKVQVRSDLYEAIKEANNANTHAAVELPVYDYPDEVITAARLQKLARFTTLQIRKEDAVFIRALDAQRAKKKAIFGSGFLLTEKAAAEKAAAEKAAAKKTAAHRWPLSDRERELVQR